MSLLVLDVSTVGVTALVVSDDGLVVGRGHRGLTRDVPEPGQAELAPEELWRAVLEATRECLAEREGREDLAEVDLRVHRGALVLWDRETLGSPRPAIDEGDRRTDDGSFGSTLLWLAAHEPRTWALVLEGRYAVGPLDSYLAARMTRGTWHVTGPASAARTGLLDTGTGSGPVSWSPELCARAGVPVEALPDVVRGRGVAVVTDARSFVGLELPISFGARPTG
jgi:glycerol kinase